MVTKKDVYLNELTKIYPEDTPLKDIKLTDKDCHTPLRD